MWQQIFCCMGDSHCVAKWFSCQTFHSTRIRFGTFQPALGLYWQVGPKQASTTRLDQLMMKQKRKEKDEQDGKEEGAPPTRGRGRGKGRGKGRGRGGRGASKGVDDGSEKEAKPKATKPKNSKGDTKERDPKEKKMKCNIGKEIWFGYTLDEWAAWGTDGAWSQTFDEQKDKEAWAWDSTAYWDQRSSAYALSKSQQPSGSSQAKPRRQTAKTTNSVSKRKETKENEYDTADFNPRQRKEKPLWRLRMVRSQKRRKPQRIQQSKRQPMIRRTRKSMNQRAKPEATAQSESRRIRSNSQKRRQQNRKGEGKPMSTTTQKQEQGPAPTDLSRLRCCMQHGREGCKRFWTLSSWSKMSQGTTSMKCLDLGWQHSARVAWMCTGAGQQLAWHAGQKRLMWATLAVQPRTAHGLSEWQQHLKQQKCLQLAGTNLVLPIVFLERNSSSNP